MAATAVTALALQPVTDAEQCYADGVDRDGLRQPHALPSLVGRANAHLRRFECNLNISGQELRTRLLAHPLVRADSDPAAYPPPPIGAPLLAYRDSGDTLALRHYASAFSVASPSLLLRWRAIPGGCVVEGELFKSDPLEIPSRDGRWVMRALGGSILGSVLLPLSLLALSYPPASIGIAIATTMLVALICVGLLSRRDAIPVFRIIQRFKRPSTRQLEAYGPPLWTLVSDVVWTARAPELRGDLDSYRQLQLPAPEPS